MTGHVCWPAVISTSVVKDKQKLIKCRKNSLFFLDLNTENYQKHEFQEKLK